jgi:predicted phage terminase large subunit-like protein
LSPEQRSRFLKSLTKDEALGLLCDWPFWARPNQLPPDGDWHTWLVLAGRGFGKTRTGAEWIRARAESGRFTRFAIIGQTAADVRDVMIEGESGLLAISHPAFMPLYEPSKRRLTWPNGAMATTYSGDEPDQLRGPQNDSAWCDELAKWRFGQETWDNMEMGLRIGPRPQVVVTTTPRPIKLIKDLLADRMTVATRGSTYENLVNLAPSFAARIRDKYEGTRLGRQELMAEILDDVPGALWTRLLLDETRTGKPPDLKRIVVAVDPEATSTDGSAETGIIVAALGIDGHGYILDDLTIRATPNGWASQAVAAYHKHKADRIIGEANQGGEMVESVIRSAAQAAGGPVAYKAVHASRGKQARAEPIAALFEQKRVHMVGAYPDLEDQLCSWVPGETSPDRLDAMVWALTELMLGTGPLRPARSYSGWPQTLRGPLAP